MTRFAENPSPWFMRVTLFDIVSATFLELTKPPIAITRVTVRREIQAGKNWPTIKTAAIFGVSFRARAETDASRREIVELINQGPHADTRHLAAISLHARCRRPDAYRRCYLAGIERHRLICRDRAGENANYLRAHANAGLLLYLETFSDKERKRE